MIEKDAVYGEHVVGLAVIGSHPVPVNLGYCIRASRSKGRDLALGWRGVAKHLAGRGLVEAGLDAASAHRFQDACRTKTGNFAGPLRHLKANHHMRLRSHVIDLVRPYVVDQV